MRLGSGTAFRAIGGLCSLITLIGAATLPDSFRAWGNHFEWLAQHVDANGLQWALISFGVVLGLACFLPWERIWRKPPQRPVDIRPALHIDYATETHYTADFDGSVQIRITVRNSGPTRVRLSSVKLVDLVPLHDAGHAGPFTTQFHAMPLKIQRAQLGMALDENDRVEVLVVHAAPGGEHFYFDCPEFDYNLPAARFRLRIVATGKGARSAERAFILDSADGMLTFDPC